jgi:hypothetical protein
MLKSNLVLYKHFALKLCELIRMAFSAIDDGTLLTLEARHARRYAWYRPSRRRPHQFASTAARISHDTQHHSTDSE